MIGRELIEIRKPQSTGVWGGAGLTLLVKAVSK